MRAEKHETHDGFWQCKKLDSKNDFSPFYFTFVIYIATSIDEILFKINTNIFVCFILIIC